MLCLECQGILKGKKHENMTIFPHHITMSNLFYAAQNKCPFCTLIWEKLLLANTEWAFLHADSTVEERSYTLLEKLDAVDRDRVADSDPRHPAHPAVKWAWAPSRDDASLLLQFHTSYGFVNFTLTPSSGEC